MGSGSGLLVGDALITLRPRQVKAVEDIAAAYQAGYCAPTLVAPTGAGKTATATHIIRRALAKGKRVWFVAHLREILQSTSSRLTAEGIPHGWIAAGVVGDRRLPVQCVMIQTLARRTHAYEPCDLMIVDEAHLAVSNTYQDVFKWAKAGPKFYKRGGCHLLCLTATPQRLDGRGLCEISDTIITTCGAQELIDEGLLSPVRYLKADKPDLSGVHTVAGEYNQHELSAIMQKPAIVGSALAHYKQYGTGRPGLGFAVDIASAKRMSDEFRSAGIRSVAVSGEDDQQARDYALTAIQHGELDFIWSCRLLVAGVDVPPLSYISDIRPTKSLTQYRQGIGRGMRTHPGKTNLIYADHSSNIDTHGNPLIDLPWTLDGTAASGKQGGMTVRTCPSCFAPGPSVRAFCGTCGFEFPVTARELEEVAGQLVEVELARARQADEAKQQRMDQGRTKTKEELIALFVSRGSTPQAAAFRAKKVIESRQRNESRKALRSSLLGSMMQ